MKITKFNINNMRNRYWIFILISNEKINVLLLSNVQKEADDSKKNNE
jgi:hypothetical protein